MKYDLIISGGYVVLADRVETTDIGIKDGRDDCAQLGRCR